MTIRPELDPSDPAFSPVDWALTFLSATDPHDDTTEENE